MMAHGRRQRGGHGDGAQVTSCTPARGHALCRADQAVAGADRGSGLTGLWSQLHHGDRQALRLCTRQRAPLCLCVRIWEARQRRPAVVTSTFTVTCTNRCFWVTPSTRRCPVHADCRPAEWQAHSSCRRGTHRAVGLRQNMEL